MNFARSNTRLQNIKGLENSSVWQKLSFFSVQLWFFSPSSLEQLQIIKELSFCHKLRFSYSYNLETCFPRPLIFQTINSGRSNSLSLKYQRFTPSGCKDIGVRKYKFVAKTQFLFSDFSFFRTPSQNWRSNFLCNPTLIHKVSSIVIWFKYKSSYCLNFDTYIL